MLCDDFSCLFIANSVHKSISHSSHFSILAIIPQKPHTTCYPNTSVFLARSEYINMQQACLLHNTETRFVYIYIYIYIYTSLCFSREVLVSETKTKLTTIILTAHEPRIDYHNTKM